MAFPDDLTMVTVTHTIADAALRPLPGVVVATPTGRQWKQGEGSILPAEYTAPIEGGVWTLALPAVDQFVNLEAYRIEERPTEGGKPWGRAYHIAPTLDHAPGPVDATDVITTPPRGGDIVFTAGPATDESMAQVARDPNSEFAAELSSTYVAQVDYPGITVDESVGTRVMVGGVMVYGDTGWRDMSGLLAADVQPSRNIGVCDFRRVNDTVYYNIKVDVHETAGALFGASFPASWLPSEYYYLPAYSASNTGAGASALLLRDTPIYVRTDTVSPDRFSAPASVPFPAQSTLVASGNYPVTTPWPTTLPGLPA